MLLTEQEAWEYLGYYEKPDDVTLRQIQRSMKAADAYVIGAVGKDTVAEDPRAKELALQALGFIYDNRTLEGKGSGAASAMKLSLLNQLKYGDGEQS